MFEIPALGNYKYSVTHILLQLEGWNSISGLVRKPHSSTRMFQNEILPPRNYCIKLRNLTFFLSFAQSNQKFEFWYIRSHTAICIIFINLNIKVYRLKSLFIRICTTERNEFQLLLILFNSFYPQMFTMLRYLPNTFLK